MYTRAEKLGMSETWCCTRCRAHVQAVKKLGMWRLPELMILIIRRFQLAPSGRVKLEAPVSFPLRLDPAPYVARAQARPAVPALFHGLGAFFDAAHARACPALHADLHQGLWLPTCATVSGVWTVLAVHACARSALLELMGCRSCTSLQACKQRPHHLQVPEFRQTSALGPSHVAVTAHHGLFCFKMGCVARYCLAGTYRLGFCACDIFHLRVASLKRAPGTCTGGAPRL